MTKTTLAQAFDIKRNYHEKIMINDYDIFTDKDLLETLRTKIAESLVDKGLLEFDKDIIDSEIDIATETLDLSSEKRNYLFNLIDNEINGYGPLTELLKNSNVTEIMVNSPKDIFIEVNGKILKEDSTSFINDEHILRTIHRLIQQSGKTINTANPIIDIRLANGLRINAIIPPLSKKGPVMTIRKNANLIYDIEDLIRTGTLTPYMARFLAKAVEHKLNILICGNAASGKSTLLNILSNLIPEEERIIVIEEAAELDLKHSNVVLLEATKTESQELIKNAIRMHPNRIIVEQIKGVEAFDVIQIMNTGHNGMLSTIHAQNKFDAIVRLETMIKMNMSNIPQTSIKEYIGSAIDLIVFIEKLNDGKRKITSISQIVTTNSTAYEIEDIFAFNKKGITNTGEVNGEFILYPKATMAYNKLKNLGDKDLEDIFEPNNVKVKNDIELPNLV